MTGRKLVHCKYFLLSHTKPKKTSLRLCMGQRKVLTVHVFSVVAIALLGFNDLGRSVTSTFLFRNRFYLQLSPHCPKRNTKTMWKVKKNSRFLFTGHGILPCCGCKARETMVAKCELVLSGTSAVD